MIFDLNKLKDDTGLDFKDNNEVINYLKDLLYYLNTHNKNYTQKQEFYIYDINNIINHLKEMKGDHIENEKI